MWWYILNEQFENKKPRLFDTPKCVTVFPFIKQLKNSAKKGSFKIESKLVLKKPGEGFHARMQSNTKEATLRKNRSQFTFAAGVLYPTRHITSNSGCPYQCKNCFRACLVSQNYMQTLLQRNYNIGFNNSGKK